MNWGARAPSTDTGVVKAAPRRPPCGLRKAGKQESSRQSGLAPSGEASGEGELEERWAGWGAASLWSAHWNSREKCPSCPLLLSSFLFSMGTQTTFWRPVGMEKAGRGGLHCPRLSLSVLLRSPPDCAFFLHLRARLLHPVLTPACVFITVRTRRTSLSISYKES